jgi:hypothetical protein
MSMTGLLPMSFCEASQLLVNVADGGNLTKYIFTQSSNMLGKLQKHPEDIPCVRVFDSLLVDNSSTQNVSNVQNSGFIFLSTNMEVQGEKATFTMKMPKSFLFRPKMIVIVSSMKSICTLEELKQGGYFEKWDETRFEQEKLKNSKINPLIFARVSGQDACEIIQEINVPSNAEHFMIRFHNDEPPKPSNEGGFAVVNDSVQIQYVGLTVKMDSDQKDTQVRNFFFFL